MGDIIDCWRLKKYWFWTQAHNDVVQKLLRKSRKGTEVTYVPGNHDEPLRDYAGMAFGGVLLRNEVVHVTAKGKRMLVVHGDAFGRRGAIRPVAGSSWRHGLQLGDPAQSLVQPCAGEARFRPTGRSPPI